jgi:DNA-binding MarR family transcriptional regulator
MYVDRDESRIERTIGLSRADLRAIVRLLSSLAGEAGLAPNSREGADRGEGTTIADVDYFALRKRAAHILHLRQARQRHFPRSMFGEPAWDILLILYVSDGRAFSIKKLSDQSGLAPTTALRWVDYLAQQRLVERDTHPTDLRTIVVRLTDAAEKTLNSYFAETLTALA